MTERKPGRRKLKSWLTALETYVEDTEAPREFWLWSGIFCVCAALQRRVWVPFGMENLYPNIYVMLVAPPGKCRKGGPPTLMKRLLQEIEIPVAVDSTSKRALTMELVEISKTQAFPFQGGQRSQTPVAIISKEMSSLLAIDPKGMIEILTDLFDSHDEWKYKTSSQGHDYLFGVCLSCLIATTPTWLAANLPAEAIGGGFTSRFVIITGYDKYKLVPIPPTPDELLYQNLLYDLNCIATLVGEFEWPQESRDVYTKWYNEIGTLPTKVKDERLHGYIERMHIMALKTAMAIHVSYSDQLIILPEDMFTAVNLVSKVLYSASDALGGQGRSSEGPEIDKIKTQMKTLQKMSFSKLLQLNYRDVGNHTKLREIMETLVAMRFVKITEVDTKGETYYEWIG